MLKEKLSIERKKAVMITADFTAPTTESYAMAWLKLCNNAREYKDVIWRVENDSGNRVYVWCNPKYKETVIEFLTGIVYYHLSKFSTYDVVYANDTLRSIFSAALGDLYEKYKSICNQDATDSIIAPLVEKYGDKSNGGMVTYRKVYKKMGEMSPINWHNLEVRYINKHGKAGARRKKIISSNPEMLRKFKNAVDVMMVG